jgi:hypothetical protein
MNKRDFIKATASGCAAASVAPVAVATATSAHAAPPKSLSLAAWRERVGQSFVFSGDGLSMSLCLDGVDDHSKALPQAGAPRIEQFSLTFSQPTHMAPACAHPALASGTCRLQVLPGRSQGLFLQPAGQTAAGAARWHAPVSRFA